MSTRKFRQCVATAQIGKNDRVWFPRWIDRYAGQARNSPAALTISTAEVIRFLRELRDNGVRAWQRVQALRAIELYRDLVLETDEPSLVDIRLKLLEIAAKERHLGPGQAGGPGVNDERKLIGHIDPREPALIREMRAELRLMHYALETERAYVGWIERFIRHCGSADLKQFGEGEIKTFLTDLAVKGDVAPSTQNQALSALLFLYQKVIGRELSFLDAVRSTKPERLPVVLSREEIARLLPEFQNRNRLMFLVMY